MEIQPTCATVSEFNIPEAAILEMSSPLVLPEQRQAMVGDLQERFNDADAYFWAIVLTYIFVPRGVHGLRFPVTHTFVVDNARWRHHRRLLPSSTTPWSRAASSLDYHANLSPSSDRFQRECHALRDTLL